MKSTTLRAIINENKITGYRIAKELGLKNTPSTRIYKIADGEAIVKIKQLTNILEVINEITGKKYTLEDLNLSAVTVRVS